MMFQISSNAAPTAPRNLEAIKAENNSVLLRWLRPLEVNGQSMTYQLWYNEKSINLNTNDTMMNETITFELVDLDSFTNYTVTVIACTSDCSPAGESIVVQTKVGKSSVMMQPTLDTFDNEQRMTLSWKPPQKRAGNLDYYQLKLVSSSSISISAPQIYQIDGRYNSCIIERLTCDRGKMDFYIRSVNIDRPMELSMSETSLNGTISCFSFQENRNENSSKRFFSEWSQPRIYYCRSHYSLIMAGTIFILSIVILIVIYVLIRLYREYLKMKDIHIVWPKGLDPNEPSLAQLNREDSFEGIKDLDLIKTHQHLTDIEEESIEDLQADNKNYENEKITERISSHSEQDESSRKSEVFLPFICDPKTNQIHYQMPKITSPKSESVPSTPSSPASPTNNYTKFITYDPHVDQVTGYMKMYAPQRSRADSNTSTEGYLDMSGKSPPPTIRHPNESDYLMNDIKVFIEDSELKNNGYIGKRVSLSDSKKRQPIINANGYVGLQTNRN